MTTDGALKVAIPASALAADMTVTVTPTSSPGGAVGTVYEIGPSGTQFSAPVTLSLHYDPANLNGAAEGSLRVATFAAGTWQILAGAAVDTSAKIVTGTTTHLSLYGLVLESNGAICGTVGGGMRCSNASMSGGVSCIPSTCADATDVCEGYPGATMTACTDDGSNGYTATCCFAPGASVCFAAGSGSRCSNGPTGTGGATCPAAPTCATATDACAAYPGATLSSCVDGTDGYSGSCCFAPGAPVCTTVGAARSCAGTGTGSGNGADAGTTCPPAPSCADGDPCAGTPGSTVQSCTDTTDGYTATCCLPVGELPPAAGGSTGSGGGVDAGRSGTTTGPTDAGTGGGHINSDGSSPPPPPPPADGGQTSDGGATACQIKTDPGSGAGTPCSVMEMCPTNGNAYRVLCDGTGAPCQCFFMGAPTSTITASCTAFDPASMLAMCGFPANG